MFFLYLCVVWSFIEIFFSKCYFGLVWFYMRIVDVCVYFWIRIFGVDVINFVDEEFIDFGYGFFISG